MPKPPINLHRCNNCCMPPMCTTQYMPPRPCKAPIISHRNSRSPSCTNSCCPKPDRLADPLVALEINPRLKEIYDDMYAEWEQREKERKSAYMPNKVDDTSSTNSDGYNSINTASRKTSDISNDSSSAPKYAMHIPDLSSSKINSGCKSCKHRMKNGSGQSPRNEIRYFSTKHKRSTDSGISNASRKSRASKNSKISRGNQKKESKVKSSTSIVASKIGDSYSTVGSKMHKAFNDERDSVHSADSIMSESESLLLETVASDVKANVSKNTIGLINVSPSTGSRSSTPVKSARPRLKSVLKSHPIAKSSSERRKIGCFKALFGRSTRNSSTPSDSSDMGRNTVRNREMSTVLGPTTVRALGKEQAENQQYCPCSIWEN